ncbi:placenta-expressed transcript 1 protein [Hippopotamus amphibius kiboko]|uniref:placenta-expressed transcript 1 protein n=1 Tax=Hippopotamus amphibius kiboko TaxID=575201 RepID=UPI0025952FCA|nr:placenta-expressed transcript 1 protein [Hippopotamus amphibius kiboko]
MAMLGSQLLPLGLLLCLGQLCPPVSCIIPPYDCLFFRSVVTATSSEIHASPNIYEPSTFYTVSVPVNNSITYVVLRVMDQKDAIIGTWEFADKYCNNSVLYHLKSSHGNQFKAKWLSPSFTNITEVELQVFTANSETSATAFYLKLKKDEPTSIFTTKTYTTKPTTTPPLSPNPHQTAPPQLITTPQLTTTTTPSHKLTTTPSYKLTTTHKQTPTHKLTTTHSGTKSSANRAFVSPVRDAFQILLVFLTSKLLF